MASGDRRFAGSAGTPAIDGRARSGASAANDLPFPRVQCPLSPVLALLSLTVYTLSLAYSTIYCLSQLNLARHYLHFSRRRRKEPPATAAPADLSPDWPFVTVQLPVYNEKYVVEQLIDCVVGMDYPGDRFEIHVLDDSTDETRDLVAARVSLHRASGVDIRQICRSDRSGFKAGALRDGMKLARGDFMAIFDADFLPNPDFLRKTIPHFVEPGVGVVQGRWQFLNENSSLLTRLQAIQLNVHFTVEQVGRMHGGHFLQFNGTAGVWRRTVIEAAGGWQADTLTEDLDLSIRAQLLGYRIKYLEELPVPSELPADMNALKAQQFRWMKGGAECARKLLPLIWRSRLGLREKINTSLHLLASTVFLFVFLMAISSVPLVYQMDFLERHYGFKGEYFSIFMSGLAALALVYHVGNVQSLVRQGSAVRATLRLLAIFPFFLSMSIGLSLHNSMAVIQGWVGKKSPFVRTPKINVQRGEPVASVSPYRIRSTAWRTGIELLLAAWFGAAVGWALMSGETLFIVFHAMMMIGFGSIGVYSWWHSRP